MMIIIIKGFWDSLVSTKAIWLGHMPYEFGMGLAAYHAKPMENDGKLMSNLNHQAIVDWVGGPNCHLLFFPGSDGIHSSQCESCDGPWIGTQ